MLRTKAEMGGQRLSKNEIVIESDEYRKVQDNQTEVY